MRRRIHLSTIVLMTLTALFLLTGLLTRNAGCRLSDPEVEAIPSEAYTYQRVLVKAEISVVYGWPCYDVRDMQASLTFPPEADLISGDNPVYIGNVSLGESRTVNWTLIFTASGIFNLNVTASGYKQDTGEYVETHGSATVTVTRLAIVGGTKIPINKLGLLAPYMSLVSTIMVGTVATAIYVKRVKRRETKNT